MENTCIKHPQWRPQSRFSSFKHLPLIFFCFQSSVDDPEMISIWYFFCQEEERKWNSHQKEGEKMAPIKRDINHKSQFHSNIKLTLVMNYSNHLCDCFWKDWLSTKWIHCCNGLISVFIASNCFSIEEQFVGKHLPKLPFIHVRWGIITLRTLIFSKPFISLKWITFVNSATDFWYSNHNCMA